MNTVPRLATLPGSVLLALSAVLTAGPLRAEVLEATESMFYLEVSRDVPVHPEQAYQQFVRVGDWWNASHTWYGDAANLSIEPVAGGCFCERAGERSVMHMQVSLVEPGSKIHLLGGLGPLQGMALQGAMVWSFEALEQGGTRILHTYRVTGYPSAGLTDLAAIVDRVQTEQVERLQSRLTP